MVAMTHGLCLGDIGTRPAAQLNQAKGRMIRMASAARLDRGKERMMKMAPAARVDSG
jgi:hypothetical protein